MTQSAQPLRKTLVKVDGLKKYFISKKGFSKKNDTIIKAVDNVSLQVFKGETLGIVGESGCGKSTMGKVLLQLQKPTAGTVHFQDQDITSLRSRKLKELRKEIQMIFQDPYGSLNQRMTVGSMLNEIVKTHHIVPRHKRISFIQNLLINVGLQPEHYWRYPHEFSGGQRQRISIARALVVQPKLIVCDEAVSALDVSVQAQILNLLKKLKHEHGLTYLFISHDLSVVRHVSDRVAVMYLGQIIETANKDRLFSTPLHPYTQALLSAIPNINEQDRERIVLQGDVPSPLNIPSGCRFHTRCPLATDVCRTKAPEYRQVTHNHFVACHQVN